MCISQISGYRQGRPKNTLPKKNILTMKNYLLLLACVCVVALCGCKKESPAPTKDIEIRFGQASLELIETDTLQKILNSKEAADIRTIYLVPMEGVWGNLSYRAMISMRNRPLEPALKLSPKIKGKGDFNFRVGEASQVPEDSLWYVQHGWTINKRFIKNQ